MRTLGLNISLCITDFIDSEKQLAFNFQRKIFSGCKRPQNYIQ